MSRVTLRMPETLHRKLERLAKEEGVSLNAYIVYSLAQSSAMAYTVHPVSSEEIERQRSEWKRVTAALGKPATNEELQAFLDAREPASKDEELSPELIAKLKKKFGNTGSDKPPKAVSAD